MKKYILLLFTTLSFAQASNQMVTFTQAQSLGFALKSGQSHVTSNQCMTKADILAKYNVTISGYADNQLVPRSAWVGSSYVYKVSSSHFNSRLEASNNPFYMVDKYSSSSSIINGMKIYNEPSLLTVYAGHGYYFKIDNYSCLISVLGDLASPEICP